MRWLSLLLGTLLLVGCSAGADSSESAGSDAPDPSAASDAGDTAAEVEPAPGDHRLEVDLGRTTPGEVLLHAPPQLERAVRRGRTLPLVVVLHGSPGTPQEMVELTGFDAIADREGFLVAYPSGFSSAEEVGALLDGLIDRWQVDPRRVYATGFSRGAATTYVLAEEMTDRIAAFAPVSGVQFGRFDLSRPVALISFEGGRDPAADSFPEVNRAWARGSDCAEPDRTRERIAGGPATRSLAACGAGTEHVVYHLDRLPHAWPRPAAELIWDFFTRHPLPG